MVGSVQNLDKKVSKKILLNICNRLVKLDKKIKFYQAGTSELYGGVYDKPQNELTPFNVIGRSLVNKTNADEGVIEAIVKINS